MEQRDLKYCTENKIDCNKCLDKDICRTASDSNEEAYPAIYLVGIIIIAFILTIGVIYWIVA